jgi:hypothetical protein
MDTPEDDHSIALRIDWSTAMVHPTIVKFWRKCDPAEPFEVFEAQREAYEKANPPYWVIPRPIEPPT